MLLCWCLVTMLLQADRPPAFGDGQLYDDAAGMVFAAPQLMS